MLEISSLSVDPSGYWQPETAQMIFDGIEQNFCIIITNCDEKVVFRCDSEDATSLLEDFCEKMSSRREETSAIFFDWGASLWDDIENKTLSLLEEEQGLQLLGALDEALADFRNEEIATPIDVKEISESTTKRMQVIFEQIALEVGRKNAQAIMKIIA